MSSQDQAGQGQVLYADIRQGAKGTVVGITCDEWLHDANQESVYPMEGGSTWDFALGGTVHVSNLQELIGALWRSTLCSKIELRNFLERSVSQQEGGEPRGKLFITIGENSPVAVLNILLSLSGGSQWPIEEVRPKDTILEPALRDAANALLFPTRT